MLEISSVVGENIRFYRKRLHMTQSDLGSLIHKGKATVAKYESGQIVLDIQTLYDIAKALCVSLDQLLYVQDESKPLMESKSIPDFFKDVYKMFVYFYDGRNKSLNESLLIIHPWPREEGCFESKLYYNLDDVDRYQLCEYIYVGKLVHYDVLSVFTLQNKSMVMEELKIVVPSTYNSEDEKFALFSGVSSRPLMPVTFKILICKRRQACNSALIKRLKISKSDLEMLKFYNMFVVM